jgi:hypothetical protein
MIMPSKPMQTDTLSPLATVTRTTRLSVLHAAHRENNTLVNCEPSTCIYGTSFPCVFSSAISAAATFIQATEYSLFGTTASSLPFAVQNATRILN